VPRHSRHPAGRRNIRFSRHLSDTYDADDEEREWAPFLAVLWRAYGSDTFTVSGLVADMYDENHHAEFRNVIPSDLADFIGSPKLVRALGRAFAKRLETRYDRWRLVKAGTKHHAAEWQVLMDPDGGVKSGEDCDFESGGESGELADTLDFPENGRNYTHSGVGANSPNSPVDSTQHDSADLTPRPAAANDQAGGSVGTCQWCDGPTMVGRSVCILCQSGSGADCEAEQTERAGVR
jgi:hypothetical protein